MENIKETFKILLVIQIICCVFASYGNPDAETIDFGLDSSRDQLIIESAIRQGMDGDAVTELLRTKQPVVKTVLLPNGVTKVSTYKFEDDGSISRNIVTKSRKSYTYNSGSIPDTINIDDLHNSPSGTITRTFTDENGHKVTQTMSVDKPKPSTVLDTDDLSGDWFNKPFPRWQHEEPSTPFHSTISRTFSGPNGERRTTQNWLLEPDFNEPQGTGTTLQAPPTTHYHSTITRTFIGPNGEKRVVQTTSTEPDDSDFSQPKMTKFPSINTDSWPGFDFSPVSQPWGSTNTDSKDPDEWTVVEGNPDVETSTKQRFETWTPKTWNWPKFNVFTTTSTTTAKPQIYTESELPTRKPLPTLDEFLKSHYGSSTTAKTTTVKATTTPKTPTTTSKSINTSSTKKPIHINLEDLPVTQIYHNGKPADEGLLKNLPPHLKPENPDIFETEHILKIDNKHPIEDDSQVEVFSPKEKTSVTTIKKTHTGPEKPTIQDLDPQMQEILKNAGIKPEDITNIDGDTITKTRIEPDGRKVTTIFKVERVPSVKNIMHKETIPVVQTTYKQIPPKVTTHTITPYKPLDISQIPPLNPTNSLSPNFSPISEFLAKLGLTKLDISSQNGRLTKTFIDDGGQVLTATFVLSSPMRNRSLYSLK